MWSTVDYLRAMFDDSLLVPSIAEKAPIVWLTIDMDSPRMDFGRNDQAGVR
jgi:hypothetical protein